MKSAVGVLSLLAVLVCCGDASAAAGESKIEIIGVAKLGDGSAADQAWQKFQKGERDQFENALKLMKATENDPNAVTARSSSGGDFSFNVESALTPAEWVIQLKPMQLIAPPEALARLEAKVGTSRNTKTTHMVSAVKGGDSYEIHLLQGREGGDWVAIRKLGSGQPGKVLQGMALMKKVLANGGQPLTAEQENQLAALLSAANSDKLIELWQRVQADAQNTAVAAEFVQQTVAAIEDVNSGQVAAHAKLLKILSPQQLQLFGSHYAGSAEARAVSSSSSGGYSVSAVNQNGKKILTITIREKRLQDAFESVVESVNSTFKAQLVVPEIPAELSTKTISCKLSLSSADGALEKLAVAAEARLEKRNGKQVLVGVK